MSDRHVTVRPVPISTDVAKAIGFGIAHLVSKLKQNNRQSIESAKTAAKIFIFQHFAVKRKTSRAVAATIALVLHRLKQKPNINKKDKVDEKNKDKVDRKDKVDEKDNVDEDDNYTLKYNEHTSKLIKYNVDSDGKLAMSFPEKSIEFDVNFSDKVFSDSNNQEDEDDSDDDRDNSDDSDKDKDDK